jgi:hypothetical protein
MKGVECTGHNNVKAAIDSQPALVRENQMDGYLSCENGTAQYPQTCWRRKGIGAPQPRWVPPRPGMPPVPSDDDERSQTEGGLPAYVYIHTPLPSA